LRDSRIGAAAIAALFGLFWYGSTPVANARPALPSRVLLISFDGFRADYFDRPAARRIRELAGGGVRAERMQPVFPTKTYPNHYSIVTGLLPIHHGIVANSIVDPSIGEFHIGDDPAVRDGRWWLGEPLWVTAEKQGTRSASLFWPGSEAPIGGVRPHWYSRYDAGVSRADRVRRILDWLAMPADSAPRFITAYFEDTDDAGHAFSPGAPQVDSAVARVDSVVGAIVDGIARLGLADVVNVILVSDHGMALSTAQQAILLDDYVSLDSLTVTDWTPVTAIVPRPGAEQYVYERLRGAHKEFALYWKADVPAKFRYDSGARISPIIGIASEGWTVSTRGRIARSPLREIGGEHGYDNQLASMQALFVAAGPAFRRGVTIPAIANLDVYPLVAELLGLVPAQTDGTLDAVRPLLKPQLQPMLRR